MNNNNYNSSDHPVRSDGFQKLAVRRPVISSKKQPHHLPPMRTVPQAPQPQIDSSPNVFAQPFKVPSTQPPSKQLKAPGTRQLLSSTFQPSSSLDEPFSRIYSSNAAKRLACEQCQRKQNYIQTLQAELMRLQNLANDLSTQLVINGIKPKNQDYSPSAFTQPMKQLVRGSGKDQSEIHQKQLRITTSRGKKIGSLQLGPHPPQEHKQPLLKRKDSFFKQKPAVPEDLKKKPKESAAE